MITLFSSRGWDKRCEVDIVASGLELVLERTARFQPSHRRGVVEEEDEDGRSQKFLVLRKYPTQHARGRRGAAGLRT